MRTGPEPCSIRVQEDHIVVSVGPYMFQTELPHRARSFASFREKASPPQSTFSRGFPSHPASRISFQVTGVACMTVALHVLNNSSNWLPSAATSRLAMTTRAPTQRGRKISSAAMSNEMVVTATSVSLGSSPGVTHMDIRKFVTDRCSISTPLGLPVDPEVKIT